MKGFFQTLGRDNDVNGNPYRLVLVYDNNARLIRAIMERTSFPNCINELRKQGYLDASLLCLRYFHLTPTFFEELRNQLFHLGLLEDERKGKKYAVSPLLDLNPANPEEER